MEYILTLFLTNFDTLSENSTECFANLKIFKKTKFNACVSTIRKVIQHQSLFELKSTVIILNKVLV